MELYGYWLKSDLSTLYDSGRNTGLTKLMNFIRTKPKLNKKILDTHVLKMDLASLNYCTLASFSLAGRNRFKKMIWPGVTYPIDTRLYEIPTGHCTSDYEFGCLFS